MGQTFFYCLTSTSTKWPMDIRITARPWGLVSLQMLSLNSLCICFIVVLTSAPSLRSHGHLQTVKGIFKSNNMISLTLSSPLAFFFIALITTETSAFLNLIVFYLRSCWLKQKVMKTDVLFISIFLRCIEHCLNSNKPLTSAHCINGRFRKAIWQWASKFAGRDKATVLLTAEQQLWVHTQDGASQNPGMEWRGFVKSHLELRRYWQLMAARGRKVSFL